MQQGIVKQKSDAAGNLTNPVPSVKVVCKEYYCSLVVFCEGVCEQSSQKTRELSLRSVWL